MSEQGQLEIVLKPVRFILYILLFEDLILYLFTEILELYPLLNNFSFVYFV